MISPFGVDHGDEVSKGLPRAVKNGGGGLIGSSLRQAHKAGKTAAQWKNHPAGRAAQSLHDIHVEQGKHWKSLTEMHMRDKRVRQNVSLPDGTNPAARRIRADLLNGDSEARRAGYKTGKSSALDRHYHGRISSRMKALP